MGPTVITMLMLETVMKMVAHCVFDLFVWHVARWQRQYGMLRAPRGAMCARG